MKDRIFIRFFFTSCARLVKGKEYSNGLLVNATRIATTSFAKPHYLLIQVVASKEYIYIYTLLVAVIRGLHQISLLIQITCHFQEENHLWQRYWVPIYTTHKNTTKGKKNIAIYSSLKLGYQILTRSRHANKDRITFQFTYVKYYQSVTITTGGSTLCSMKQLRVLLLPLVGMLIKRRFPPPPPPAK